MSNTKPVLEVINMLIERSSEKLNEKGLHIDVRTALFDMRASLLSAHYELQRPSTKLLDSVVFAANLKFFRIYVRTMALEDLETITGIRSYRIELIESGKGDPTLSEISSLASAMRIPASLFFSIVPPQNYVESITGVSLK